jgi:hypothetical protein
MRHYGADERSVGSQQDEAPAVSVMMTNAARILERMGISFELRYLIVSPRKQ